jgi:hypothetical protein
VGARLSAGIDRVRVEPGLPHKPAAIGTEPAGSTREAFATFRRSEYSKRGEVVRRFGAAMDGRF